MSIIAHIHNAEGHDIGYICGPPVPDKKGRRIIRHARGCSRHGKPFIRTASGELDSLYLCYACHRAFSVIADWGDLIDGTRAVQMSPEWWGWRHAEAVEAYQIKGAAPGWVQERGQGIAHYQLSWGFSCGRAPMDWAMVESEPKKRCRYCVLGLERRAL